MTTLTLYQGRRGADGADGIDGLTPSEVNDTLLSNPMFDALRKNKLSTNAPLSFNRSDIASYTDRYGMLRTTAGDSSTNFVTYSNDYTQWSDILSQWTIIGPATDPFGGSDATEIELDQDTRNPSGTIPVMGLNFSGLEADEIYIASFYIRVISGAIENVEYSEDSDYFDAGSISSEWQLIKVRVSNNSSSTRFGISPRGASGSRFAVYGAQFQRDFITERIPTNGQSETIELESDNKRQTIDGYLIEEGKKNFCHNSLDFTDWSITTGSFESSPIKDPFGFDGQLSKIVYGSLSTIEASTTTDPLTEGQTYSVSFYAYVSGGSITSLRLSIGNGPEVEITQPSVTSYQRITVNAVAGDSDGLRLIVVSDPLNAQLNCVCWNLEEGQPTNYIPTAQTSKTRDSDLVFCEYYYNIPNTNNPWSFIFSHSVTDTQTKRFIFSNTETDSNEFSLFFENGMLNLKLGASQVSAPVVGNQIAVTFNGSQAKFYNGTTLVYTESLSPSLYTAGNVYFGSDGATNFIDASLSDCMFFDEELLQNDITYLLGVA